MQIFETAVWCPGDQYFNFKNCAENFCFTFSIAIMAENETQRKHQIMI